MNSLYNYGSSIDYVQGTPHLFISDQWAASNPELLKKNGIRYVLNVTPIMLPEHYGIKYKKVPLLDDPRQEIIQSLPECFEFLDEAYMNQCNVLVHCQAGISRSSSIIIAYLLHKTPMNYDEALSVVKNSRPIVNPNVGFEQQLRHVSRVLKSR